MAIKHWNNITKCFEKDDSLLRRSQLTYWKGYFFNLTLIKEKAV